MKIYVASSWRCQMHVAVVEALRASEIDCYDFRNPPDSSGFSWREVKPEGGPDSISICEHCGKETSKHLRSLAPDTVLRCSCGCDMQITSHQLTAANQRQRQIKAAYRIAS